MQSMEISRVQVRYSGSLDGSEGKVGVQKIKLTHILLPF